MKDINNKLAHPKALEEEADRLGRIDPYIATWGRNMGILADMITLLAKIDLTKLSVQTNDKVRELEKEIENNVDILHEEEEDELYITKGLNLLDSLRLIGTKLTEEKNLPWTDRNNYAKGGAWIDIWELYGSDEVLTKAYKLIIELAKEYVSRETTNILQYTLRL